MVDERNSACLASQRDRQVWLVLGLFLQQRELAANNVAIQRQFEIMQRTAEQAEIQTRAIAANELHVRQADSQDGWALFYGTPIRKQHCENYIRSFEHLPRSAAACDPEVMIVDALHGNAQGRLYRLMCTLRDSPSAGVTVAG